MVRRTRVTPSRGQVLFHMQNVDVVAQLIDQRFPDYQPIIPKRFDTRTIVSTADMLKACRQASIFARESSDTMRLKITPNDDVEPGKVIVTARADETGDNESQLEANSSGNGVEIAFNVKFMIDVLSVIDSPQVALETTTAKSPGLLRPLGDDNFLHVVMPMHLPR